MAWLVDTDILSEPAQRQPDSRVLKWLEENEAHIFTSSHVIGELQHGISLLSEGARRRAFQAWLNQLLEAMEGRILNFNTTTATVWGRQTADFDHKGCAMPMPDSFIAATARRHNLVIATRNTKDFARPGLKTFNPAA